MKEAFGEKVTGNNMYWCPETWIDNEAKEYSTNMQIKECEGSLWVPSESLILRESLLGLKGRPSSCRLTLNGAPLRTTKALEVLKPSVLCLWRFSDFSRLACCMFKSVNL